MDIEKPIFILLNYAYMKFNIDNEEYYISFDDKVTEIINYKEFCERIKEADTYFEKGIMACTVKKWKMFLSQKNCTSLAYIAKKLDNLYFK